MSSKTAARLGQDGEVAGRSDVHHLDPRWITIVRDKSHVLYDARVDLPLDESLIESIQRQGVLKPVILRMNGPLKELVAGRRRVMHALEVLRRQLAAGVEKEALIRVPCLLKRLTDAQAAEAMIDENEGSLPDTLANRAMKAQRLLDLTGDRDLVGRKFKGLNLEHLLFVIELAPEVQAAIDQEELPLSAAPDMARIRREDQPQRLAEIKKAGLNRGSQVRKTLKAVASGKAVAEISTFKGLLPSRMKGLAGLLLSDRGAQADLAACVTRAGGAHVLIAQLLRYAAGDETALRDFYEIRELAQKADADLTARGVITGSAKAKKTRAQREGSK